MELENQLAQYVADNLVYLDEPVEPTTSLIGEGLIDSVGIIELVTYVQNSFGIAIEQHEITLDNFDSIRNVAAFIRAKQLAQEDPERPAPAPIMRFRSCATATGLT